MADDYRRQDFELERRIFEVDNKCSSLRAEKQDDDYLQNASAILEKLKSFYRHGQGGESFNLPKLLQDYTQVILDITFYEENQLVDQEFPEDSSPFKIQQLLQDLTEPEVLVARLTPGQEAQSVLGTELLECLYWRRGALLYMYCHTLHQRKQWIKKNKDTFIKCIQEGVRYLMRMLQVRNTVKLSDGVVLHDSSTASILSEGIFSDTHLLTMMYIGEMCFWAVKYEDCSADPTDHKDDGLQFRDIGTQILNKYVNACEGPLQGQGWNTENAKEILSILQ